MSEPAAQDQPTPSRRGVDPVALAAAVLISGVLGFAAFAKFYEPNPDELIFGNLKLDLVVASAEVLVILALLALHRVKWVWAGVGVMFLGFLGYTSFWTFSKGEPCGCFGTLWVPPQGVMIAIDTVLALLALGMAWRRGAGLPLLAAALIAGAAAGVVGWQYGYAKSPEKVEAESGGKSAMTQLVESELLAEARELNEMGVPVLVFVWEQGCPTCEMYLQDMRTLEALLADNEDFFLRVVIVEKTEAEQIAGIPKWGWESSPVTFVMRDGAVDPSYVWRGEELPFDVYALYEDLTGAPFPY